MFPKITFLAILISSPLITNANNMTETIVKRFLENVGRAKKSSMQEITGDSLLTELCKHNESGNYQNPFNCNQFIMCDYQRTFLCDCADGTGAYNPIGNFCGYIQPPPYDTCPWKSIWSYSGGVSCQTLGKAPYWGYLTLPKKPEQRCGRDIVHCKNYQVTFDGWCGPGFAYSKAFLACIPVDLCYYIDSLFGL